jgi:hypothetical protein
MGAFAKLQLIRAERRRAMRMVLASEDVPKEWSHVSLRLNRAGKSGKSELASRARRTGAYTARTLFQVRRGEEFWAKILPTASKEDAETFPPDAPSWFTTVSPDFVGTGAGPMERVTTETHEPLANAVYWEREVYGVPGTGVNRVVAGAVENIAFAVGIGARSSEDPWDNLTALAMRQADKIREVLDEG